MDLSVNKATAAPLKEEYAKMGTLCTGNLETALANLPLHLPATMDMIVALLFGVGSIYCGFLFTASLTVARPTTRWKWQSQALPGR